MNASPPGVEVSLEYPRQYLEVAHGNADRILLIQNMYIMGIIKSIIKLIVWSIIIVTLIFIYMYNVIFGLIYSIVISMYIFTTIDDDKDK